mgnify:CR=1 FL=1
MGTIAMSPEATGEASETLYHPERCFSRLCCPERRLDIGSTESGVCPGLESEPERAAFFDIGLLGKGQAR